MVDRREALKKLAAGASIALTAPLVIGSNVFADSGTANCVPTPFDAPIATVASSMGVTAIAGAPGYVQLLVRQTTVAFGNIACPAGFTRANSYRWDIAGSPGPNGTIVQNGGGLANISGQWGSDFRVRIVTAGPGSTLVDDGNYVVTVQFRVACSNGTRVCWRCATFTVRFTWTAATDTVVTTSITSALGSTNCNDSQP